jgi:hypothetical protein
MRDERSCPGIDANPRLKPLIVIRPQTRFQQEWGRVAAQNPL